MEVKFTDQNFASEALNFRGVVLVDFFATWCGPCKMQGPIIEELARELDGQLIKVGKLDIDQNPATTEKYEVMSVPTLIILKNGEVIESLVGLHGKDVLKEKLMKILS